MIGSFIRKTSLKYFLSKKIYGTLDDNLTWQLKTLRAQKAYFSTRQMVLGWASFNVSQMVHVQKKLGFDVINQMYK